MSNRTDLTGKIFGRWKVLKYFGRRNSATLWECQCECGNIRVVSRGSLRAGTSQSCGCLKNKPAHNRKDFVGQKFGKLTAIRFVETRNKRAHFLFKCECGNKKVLCGKDVRRGAIKSCGCLLKSRFDLVGSKFNRLTVLKLSHIKGTQRIWECICECGNITHKRTNTLKSGRVYSCGCYLKESAAKRARKHDMSRSTEYVIWAGILQRCNNPKDTGYSGYGERGITVCERWLKFENFFLDMGNRPSKKHSIDRIDNNGDYTPENCRWATAKQQIKNRRPPQEWKNTKSV